MPFCEPYKFWIFLFPSFAILKKNLHLCTPIWRLLEQSGRTEARTKGFFYANRTWVFKFHECFTSGVKQAVSRMDLPVL